MRSKTRLLADPSGSKAAGVKACLGRLAPLVVSVCLVALGMPAVSAAATEPPSITSAFVPNSIGVAETTSLSYTITNPNTSGSLTGVSLADTLPIGVVVDNPNGESGSCGSSSVITANPGSNTISLAGGSVKGGATCTFSVDVTSSTPAIYTNSTGTVSSTNGGNGNSDTESLTVVGPPTISVSTPHNNATYNFGERVITTFSCQEAADGPGIEDCSGEVDESTSDLTSGAHLPTSLAGPHTFTISAVSGDGEVVTDTINYKVRPDNRFTVSHVKSRPSGSVSYTIKLPGPGRVEVRELASGSTFGEKTLEIGHTGTFAVTVRPSRRAKPSKLVIAAQISFRPKGGEPRTITVHGIHVT